MKKVVLALLMVLVVPTAHAAGDANCASKVIEIAGWQALPQEQLQCIRQHPDFVEGLKYLCSANHINLSPEYTKYRSYEIAYEETFAKFMEAEDPAEKVSYEMKMQSIDRDWMIFGYREEVSQSLNLIAAAEYRCSPRSK